MAEHESYFGCPITFDAGCNRLVLNSVELDRPFALYNAELLEMITPQLEHAQSLRRSSGSAEIQVLRTLQHVLPGGQFDIGAVAKELGASKRSLQRRVAQEGTSFRLLVTKARQELAREHLANPSIELKEVAFLLGFDDANSFYRAVRQWQGTTPAKWRAELTALPASSSTPSRIDLL